MNVLKRAFFSVFPKPRRPVSWIDALPLVLFLALYGGVVVWLEAADVLLFARPALFALVLVAPWVWWMHVAGAHGLGRIRGTVSLATRLLLVGLFVMLLAEPRAVRTRDSLSVVYALDISDSIDQASTDAALEFVAATVHDKPQDDEAGLIVFGRNASVELPPRMSFPLEESIHLNSRIDRDATDLEQALSLSAAMLPEENPGRVVLISDGTATQGNLSRVLDELKARDIAVDVLPIQYGYEEEVWLEQLELPQYVKIGENYEAAVVLSSLADGEGTLVLKENGQTVYEGPVKYQAGKNRYVIPIKLREPGYYEYAATIETPKDSEQVSDHLTTNNTVINYIFVEGEGRVLVVTQPEGIGDPRDHEALVQAMREGKRAVDVIDAYQLPQDSLSLMPYDAIVFVNVPADMLDQLQMEAVHDAVKDQGAGFLMVGGPQSFGPGGYHHTVVEKVLPVSMDVTKKKVLPKGALVIVLHTCEFPEGNTWAKRITKQAIKVLGSRDEVGVVIYDVNGQDKWVFKLTPAGEYPKLFPKINACQPADMPSFVPSMQMGYNELVNSDAATRHMIVISDGDPAPPPQQLLMKYKANQITITTVSVFPHGGIEINMMQSIANLTGGKYYTVDS
ncbi:MAG: VWA domain-containing protein, partial [Planctomycetaceae bacterium]